MQQFLMGMAAAGFLMAALFFFRFWRETRDRLFAIFAIAFVLLAAMRWLLALSGKSIEPETLFYWGRFFAFILILLAILDKNRPRHESPEKSVPASSEQV